MTLEEFLSSLEELDKNATPGKWVWRVPGYLCNKYIDEGLVLADWDDKWHPKHGDAKFIAASRDAVPKLVKIVRELLDEMRFEPTMSSQEEVVRECERILNDKP